MEDRAAIGAGLESGLCQARIARMLGRSPSVIRGGIKRNAGADGCYRGEEAGRMAARRRARPKERALEADPVLRVRVVSDLARGRTPRQISGRLKAEACGKVGTMADSPAADGRTISHEAIYTWIYTPSRGRNLVEHGIVLPSRRWARKRAPAGGRKPPIVGMRLIDERPDIDDRAVPGNWEGDLIIGKDGASACATLVERATRYLVLVGLPLGRRADLVRAPSPAASAHCPTAR